MPIYEYKCRKCGTVSEHIQKFSDDPLTDCGDCGCAGALEKLMSLSAFPFERAQGWYVTDYGRRKTVAVSCKHCTKQDYHQRTEYQHRQHQDRQHQKYRVKVRRLGIVLNSSFRYAAVGEAMLPNNGIYDPYFNITERTFVYSALEEAAEYLRDFYCFSPREWFNYCYDVLTEGEGALDTSQRSCLCRSTEIQTGSSNPDAPGHRLDHYQIRLYDQQYSQKAVAPIRSGILIPFMVYILTHELIHIARFCQNLHPFDCDPEFLEKEEQKVDRLTREVLKDTQEPLFFPDRETSTTYRAPLSNRSTW